MKDYLDAVPPRAPMPIAFSPGSFPWKGQTYSISTDGHRAMIVKGEHAPAKAVPAGAMEIWLCEVPMQPSTMADFVAALRPHNQPSACDLCKGAREVDEPIMITCHECDGDGTVECGECGHESDCDHCGGDGEVKSKRTRKEPCRCVTAALPVAIAGRYLDLRLLLPVLEQLPDQPVQWGWLGAALDPLRIDGEGWHFLIMPMRHEGPAPVIELGGAQ